MVNNEISGTALGPDGNPVEGAVIRAVQQGIADPKVGSTETDSNGEFVIDGDVVGGDGPWHVTGRYEDANGEYHHLSYPSIDATLLRSATLSFTDGGDQQSLSETGIEFQTKTELSDISFTLQQDTESWDTATGVRIEDADSGNIIAEDTSVSLDAGDQYTFEDLSLAADVYYLLFDYDEYHPESTHADDTDYPHTTELFDIEQSVFRGGDSYTGALFWISEMTVME